MAEVLLQKNGFLKSVVVRKKKQGIVFSKLELVAASVAQYKESKFVYDPMLSLLISAVSSSQLNRRFFEIT